MIPTTHVIERNLPPLFSTPSEHSPITHVLPVQVKYKTMRPITKLNPWIIRLVGVVALVLLRVTESWLLSFLCSTVIFAVNYWEQEQKEEESETNGPMQVNVNIANPTYTSEVTIIEIEPLNIQHNQTLWLWCFRQIQIDFEIAMPTFTGIIIIS